MGGGEGRASGGHPRSRKGLLAKGYKTRNPKKTTSKFIISRKQLMRINFDAMLETIQKVFTTS